jgi:hypothetical protein
MFNVDELYSKNCIPSYIEIDPETGSISRCTYPEMKPVIINSEDEAIDDNTMYLIISNEAITVNKPNVFVKYKLANTLVEGDSHVDDIIELGSINKDKIFNVMFPELSDNERRILRMYANSEIQLVDVITGNVMQIVNKTRKEHLISEVELDAEMEGLLDRKGSKKYYEKENE